MFLHQKILFLHQNPAQFIALKELMKFSEATHSNTNKNPRPFDLGSYGRADLNCRPSGYESDALTS